MCSRLCLETDYFRTKKNAKKYLGAVWRSFLSGWPIIGSDGTATAFLTESFQAPAPFFRNSILKLKILEKSAE